MDDRTQELLDRILENRELLKKPMRWETQPNMMMILGAMILSSKGKKADPEKYEACKAILKRNAGFFSEFRGIPRGMVLSKMSIAPDPEAYLTGCLDVYKKLRAIHKLIASPYMVMAAMTLYEYGGQAMADTNIAKLEEFYQMLHQKHPFLISDEDRGYLAMLVTCGLDLAQMDEMIEANYQACKGITVAKNSVNSLAQVLALSNMSPEQNAVEVKNLIAALKAHKCPFSMTKGLSAVGALTLLSGSAEQKAQRVSEIYQYLQTKKGFKWYDVDRTTRTVYACLIDFMANADEIGTDLAESIGSTLTMVLVEQMIMAVIIVCATTSQAATHSS